MGVPKDIVRIARSKFKLAQFLSKLHDPFAEELNAEALRLKDELSGAALQTNPFDDDVFDDMVAYI